MRFFIKILDFPQYTKQLGLLNKIMMRLTVLFLVLLFRTHSVFAHSYGVYKVGTPYKVDGTQYKPKEVSQYRSQGIASWYGKDFDGKNTANGAIFNSRLRTAAHTTLPMPSAVIIRNLDNGLQTIAVVNDRGPFSHTEDRIIDVSKKVAEDLGFIDQGRANVEIEYIPDLSQKLKNNEDINVDDYLKKYRIKDKNTTPAIVTNNIDINQEFADAKKIGKSIFINDYVKNFYVQVGVFQQLPNAQGLYKKLSNNAPKMQIRSETQDVKNYYVVRSGPFNKMEEAQASKKVIDTHCQDCHAMIIII
jgi:rare lipoprotein A